MASEQPLSHSQRVELIRKVLSNIKSLENEKVPEEIIFDQWKQVRRFIPVHHRKKLTITVAPEKQDIAQEQETKEDKQMATRILDLLAISNICGLTARHIGTTLDIPKATVNRLLHKTLVPREQVRFGKTAQRWFFIDVQTCH